MNKAVFNLYTFYIHDSVHRDSVLIRCNKMQQSVCIYLLQVYSTYFERPSRPPSGVQETVTAASGTVSCTPDDGRDGRPKYVE